MDVQRVAVLGGGPGGLYAARLLKLASPGTEVVVYEQDEPDSTFGFGVGLAARTQTNLQQADADTHADILASGWRHDMSMQVGDQLAVVHTDRLIGIARTELLAILQRHAEKAGVDLRFGVREHAENLDADLVIAADGVGSATRRSGDFGSQVSDGRGVFLWCGAPLAIDRAVFAPVESEHGTFVTHAYPYARARSTFLIETDEGTWRRAGFDRTTATLSPGASDRAALEYLSDLFADHLQGHALLGNRTRWTRFRTVHCARWHDADTVLLGDAAHTAHPSIGSGTKLAMEDAIALVDALTRADDLAAALHEYERVRRPDVERLQELARRSQLWWESFPDRMHRPVDQLMISYMTRAGKVQLPRFAEQSPDIVRRALANYSPSHAPDEHLPSDIPAWVLAQPLTYRHQTFASRILSSEDLSKLVVTTPAEDPGTHDGRVLVDRLDVSVHDPWDDAGHSLVALARQRHDVRTEGFWLTGPPDRPSVLSRLDLSERLKNEIGALTIVGAPSMYHDDLAAGLVSGRTDLVDLEEET